MNLPVQPGALCTSLLSWIQDEVDVSTSFVAALLITLGKTMGRTDSEGSATKTRNPPKKTLCTSAPNTVQLCGLKNLKRFIMAAEF